MCGIAGAIGKIDQSVIDAVKRINSAQTHRGPDGGGLWHHKSIDGEGVVLAHRRLAIIDLSSEGAQPMLDKSNGNVIVFNGEIYNFLELKSELENNGHQFHSHSDTEVLLAAYRHWGRELVSHLRGMFAFVIWDAKEKKAFMVRDRVGIKPLYYSIIEKNAEQTLIFASEMTALLESGLIPRKLSPDAISSYIWNGFVTGPSSIISGVELLPSGTSFEVNDKGNILQTRKFWDLSSHHDSYDDPSSIKDCLEDTVNIHMISDVPVGVFLSGGIDSSAVAALAASCSDSPINTFNISFDESRFDESPYAKQVAKSLGTDHHEIQLTQSAFIENIEEGLSSMDQPTFDGINTYFVSKAVAEAGIKVALAGTGGDELFGGYKSFIDIPRTLKWARLAGKLPSPLLNISESVLSQILRMYFGAVPPQTRWGKLADVFQTQGDILGMYQTVYSLFTNNFRKKLQMNSATSLDYGMAHSFAEEIRALIKGQGQLEAISNLELIFFIGQRLLRDTDAASMASSIEVRVPLLDHVLIEKASRIQADKRYLPLGSKGLLRSSALSNLDPAIFDRPKSGFTLPFELWCRENLKDKVESLLTDKNLCHAVGLNVEVTTQLFIAFQKNSPGIYWSRVWSIYCLLWWCKKHQSFL